MNNLQVFNFNTNEVRVSIVDGQPWWVAKDICAVLDIDQSQTRRLEDDEKGLRSIQTLGGDQQMLCVNEPGLYSLVIGSRKPEAKEFKRWVTHDVLPSIRKTGMYATQELLDNPDLLIAAATQLKQERAERARLEQQAAADAPKVAFANAVAGSSTSILVRELAVIMRQNGIDIGEKRLFVWMRQNGYLIRREGTDYNMPTQRSVELGVLEVKETVIQRTEGAKVQKTPKVTGKGQTYFINKLQEVMGNV